MCISWPRICFTVHLLWCISYIIIGTIQVIFGVFFIALPVLKLGSNIWVGIWNITFGIGGAVYAMIGKWTINKQRIFLYVAISVLIANVVNLVVLEIGEWHVFLPENFKKFVHGGNLKMVVLYARTIISLCTILVALIAFVDSQITFCSMQYHERYYRKKQNEKQDILSDTEYILPRVKSDSDENENASFYNKQYPQSWVYKTQTAETSTINSAMIPNRLSGSSSDNLIDSKQTPSEAEFKDISTQNLSIEQPIVVVENTSDYTDRQLHYMTSFSRTPSPVPGSDSSSENSCSIRAPQPQTSLSKRNSTGASVTPSQSSGYRSRLDSAKSTSAVPIDRSSASISPRPPSISGIDQLQADLQERFSNKSFKISADQIFIPLKDETVIRINDEVFVTPNKKTTTTTTTTTTLPLEQLPPPVEAKHVTRPSLPEVVQVLRKEHSKDPSPTREKNLFDQSNAEMKNRSPVEKRYSNPPLAVQFANRSSSSSSSTSANIERPKSISTSVELTATSPHVKYTSPVTEKQLAFDDIPPPKPASQQSLHEAMEQYLKSTAKSTPSPDKLKISPDFEQQQTKIEADDTIITSTARAAGIDSESFASSSPPPPPQFDRQDTVIRVRTPTSQSERQSFIERQDAIMSPKEDQSYVYSSYVPTPENDADVETPSSVETEVGTNRDLEDESRISSEDAASNNSNNTNTTIIDFKNSQSDTETGSSYREAVVFESAANLVESISPPSQHRLGNEIDDIFRIAEVNGDLARGNGEFDIRVDDDDVIDNIPPPPDVDAHAFVSIPPPEVMDDELNGVDPDEWEESEDDSVDSSCIRPIPPPSMPIDK